MQKNLFFELIDVALNHADKLSHIPTEEEWKSVFELSQKQSLVGICFTGIECLPKEQLPHKKMLLAWYAATAGIEEQNRKTNIRCIEISKKLRDAGYLTCILKGQGSATYYPQPMRRQSGDIDIWIRRENGSLEEDRKVLIDYVRKDFPDAICCYHHIDYNLFSDVPIEVHFMPTWLNHYGANKRLQKWFEEVRSEQFRHIVKTSEGPINAPTDAFNAIFLFLHISKHILQEGVGLRQFLDYYYLLIKGKEALDKDVCCKLLKSFGLYKMSQAVMYVMQEVFKMPKEYLLCDPNKRLGKFLIDEIMLSGNFGHYDPRFGNLHGEKHFHKFLRKQKRIIRFSALSPSEVMWSPAFSIFHWFWRKRHNTQI